MYHILVILPIWGLFLCLSLTCLVSWKWSCGFSHILIIVWCCSVNIVRAWFLFGSSSSSDGAFQTAPNYSLIKPPAPSRTNFLYCDGDASWGPLTRIISCSCAISWFQSSTCIFISNASFLDGDTSWSWGRSTRITNRSYVISWFQPTHALLSDVNSLDGGASWEPSTRIIITGSNIDALSSLFSESFLYSCLTLVVNIECVVRYNEIYCLLESNID
jgi:hypothetical protein